MSDERKGEIVYLEDYREPKLWPKLVLLALILAVTIGAAKYIVDGQVDHMKVGKPFDK